MNIKQETTIKLLLKSELMAKLKITKTKMNTYLADGMPHYLFGNEFRFLEEEVTNWLLTYEQVRLEREFRDKKGRTIKDYVTEDMILKVLRISKEKLAGLSRIGLPYEVVGKKEFYHIQDILDYYRKGSMNDLVTETITPPSAKPKKPPKNGALTKFLTPLCHNKARTVPFLILDGSYDFHNGRAGTGLILVENRHTATGLSNVRNVNTTKPIVSEYFALLDALHLVKKRNITKAIIVTDQEHWTRGLSIEANTYEESVAPYINELNQLWKKLKKKIELKYVGEMDNGSKNVLYKKAHDLSRAYKHDLHTQIELK